MSDLVEIVARGLAGASQDEISPNTHQPLWMAFRIQAERIASDIERAGLRIVPALATDKMIHAGEWCRTKPVSKATVCAVYDSMLAAAPKVSP